MPKITYAHQIYNDLMDLELVLGDINFMGPLRMFLESVDQDSPSLKKLHREILDFKNRIEKLAEVARKTI